MYKQLILKNSKGIMIAIIESNEHLIIQYLFQKNHMNKNKEYILCAAIWIKAAGEFIHQPKIQNLDLLYVGEDIIIVLQYLN